ncbi:MAG: hypothetical protein ABIG63_17730 [Chloroflexota bacterium]
MQRDNHIIKKLPIRFTGQEVRALLDGRKTQTHKAIKPQPKPFNNGVHDWAWETKTTAIYWRTDELGESLFMPGHCPYGQPGDLLWVRETWKPSRSWVSPEICNDTYIRYKADNSRQVVSHNLGGSATDRWRPSIHMPRWASRITLEVVNVRVERVQEIGIESIIAEGIDAEHRTGQGASTEQLRSRFAGFWDSINAKRGFGWDKNPWVWVIEFKVIDK